MVLSCTVSEINGDFSWKSSIFSHFPCLWLYWRDDIDHLIISIKIWFLYDSDEQRRLWFCYFTSITFVTQRMQIMDFLRISFINIMAVEIND